MPSYGPAPGSAYGPAAGMPGPGMPPAPGYASPGYGSPGYGSPGYSSPGYSSPGYGPQGYGPAPGAPQGSYPGGAWAPVAPAPQRKPSTMVIVLVLAALAGAWFLFQGTTSKPEDVMARWLDGWANQDVEKIMATVKPAMREQWRPQVEKIIAQRRAAGITLAAENRTYVVQNQQKEECLVVASYVMVVTQQGQAKGKEGKKEGHHMVLIDRSWYIDDLH